MELTLLVCQGSDMPRQKDSVHLLKQVFQENLVPDLPELCTHTGSSRRTVMRWLKRVGYHTSYNLNSRYYALEETPQFDEDGLWGHEEIWFSSYGTLRRTVRALVEKSEAGMTANELRAKLHVRVDTRMGVFVKAGDVASRRYGRLCVYYSAGEARADVQMAKREQMLNEDKEVGVEKKEVVGSREMAMNVIEALVTKIEHPDWGPVEISKDLVKRGIDMPVEGVRATFEFLKLSKKNSARET